MPTSPGRCGHRPPRHFRPSAWRTRPAIRQPRAARNTRSAPRVRVSRRRGSAPARRTWSRSRSRTPIGPRLHDRLSCSPTTARTAFPPATGAPLARWRGAADHPAAAEPARPVAAQPPGRPPARCAPLDLALRRAQKETPRSKGNLTAVKFPFRMAIGDVCHTVDPTLCARPTEGVSMATISTTEYLLDQARRRFTPSFNNFPGMGLVEQKLRNTQFPETILAEPPPGSGLKPVVGDRGLPILGH